MKTISPIVFSLIATASISAAPMKDRVSGEELSALRTASASPVSTLAQPQAGDQQAARPSKESIISQSLILSDGTNWTLIPRGSVLYLPEGHQDKIGGRPVGNLLSWKDFLAANRAWLSAEDVSLRQAEGLQSMDERRTAFWPKQGKVIVASYIGGPISVTPPETVTAATR